MTRRIRIKLTSASWQPSGWRWRAADAREPKGFIPTALVPQGARVDDILTVELSSSWKGSEVLRVISPDPSGAADSATSPKGSKSSKKTRQRKARDSTKAENVAAIAKIREFASQGRIEEATALCEERGWDPGKTDPRLRIKEEEHKPVTESETSGDSEVAQLKMPQRAAQAKLNADSKLELRRQGVGISVSQGNVSGPAFFDVRNDEGNLEIRISDSHPSLPLLLGELEPSAQSVLLMVLQGWAEMESNAVGTARQTEIEDARLEWGRYLRHLLMRFQDQS